MSMLERQMHTAGVPCCCQVLASLLLLQLHCFWVSQQSVITLPNKCSTFKMKIMCILLMQAC